MWNCLTLFFYANSWISLGCSCRRESARVGFMFRYLDQILFLASCSSFPHCGNLCFRFPIFNHRMWNLAFWSGAQCHSIKVTTCVCHVSPFLATLVLNQRVKFHFCHCVSTFSLLFILFTHHPACIWYVMIVSWHEPESSSILRCHRSFVDFLKCLNHFKNAPELSHQHCFPVK